MGICLVMKNNFRRSLRHKIRWAIIFLMPLILSPCTILINQIQENTYRVGVVDSMASDNSTSDHGAECVESVCSILNENQQVKAHAASVDTYHADLICGTYHYVVDCSKGFTKEAIISTKTEKDNEEFFQNVLNSQSHEDVTANGAVEKTKLLNLQQSVSFLMSLFMIMSVVQGGMYLRDKNQGLITRYCYTPKKKSTYLMGNLCYIFLITLIQVIISFLLLCTVNGIWLSLETSIRLIAVITTVASVFTMLLCAACKNDTQAGISASAVAAFCTVISGIFVSVESMPQVLQFISRFNPVHWCMEIMKFQ